MANQKHHLHSVDPLDPNARLIIWRGEKCNIDIYEAQMTGSSPTAEECAVHDRLVLTPQMARWLRATLNEMDLED